MIDLTYLKKATGDNEALIKSMLVGIDREMVSNLDETDQAIEAEDWKNASRMAHSLKTTVSYLSYSKMAERLKELEHNFLDARRRDEAISKWNQLKDDLLSLKEDVADLILAVD